MPSEALPIVVGSVVKPIPDAHAVLSVSGTALTLQLASRKNCKQVTTMKRECICHKSKSLCIFHVVGNMIKELQDGTPLFGGLSGASALTLLRNRLNKIGVVDARSYKLHDMRRGHAQDLAIRGASLSTILKAGGWKSSAFLAYLDCADLEVLLFDH